MFIKAIKFIGQVIVWLFTDPVGAVVQGTMWGMGMTVCALISGKFSEYGALAYGVAFFITFFAAIILALLIGWIWTHIAHRLGTSKPTFIKLKVEEWALHVVDKGNIYKIPYMKSLEAILAQVPPAPVIEQGRNRKENRAAASTKGQKMLPAVVPNPYAPPAQADIQHHDLSAIIVVQFQTPILPSDFLIKLEKDGGASPPKLVDQAIDERWALVTLSNMKEGASFTIHFNHKPKA